MQNQKIIKNFTLFFFFSLAVLGNTDVLSSERSHFDGIDVAPFSILPGAQFHFNPYLVMPSRRQAQEEQSFSITFGSSARSAVEQSPEIFGQNFLMGAGQAAGQLAVIKLAENVSYWRQDPTEKILLKNEKKQEQIEKVNGQLIYLINQKNNVSHLLKLYEKDPTIAKSLQKQLEILAQKEKCFILKLEELYTEWTDMKVSTKPPTKETDIQKNVIFISDKPNPSELLKLKK